MVLQLVLRLLVVCFEVEEVLLGEEALLVEAVDRFEFVEAVDYLEEVGVVPEVQEAEYMPPLYLY